MSFRRTTRLLPQLLRAAGNNAGEAERSALGAFSRNRRGLVDVALTALIASVAVRNYNTEQELESYKVDARAEQAALKAQVKSALDTLPSALSDAGVNEVQSHAVMKTMKPILDPDNASAALLQVTTAKVPGNNVSSTTPSTASSSGVPNNQRGISI